jgi:hypothetical protein
MNIPRIGSGIGALTPEVWEQMATAARDAAAVNGQPSQRIPKRDYPLAGHWNLAGTFLAQLTGHADIADEDNRWSYSWTHFVPFVNDDAFFNITQQPATPTQHNTQDGTIVQPFNGLFGSASSKTHILPTDQEIVFSCAYNLSEWNNTASFANGVDIAAAAWPAGMELQPIITNDADAAKHPLVVMHWTRYVYKEENDYRSRMLFFFDRQNHFDGDCS